MDQITNRNRTRAKELGVEEDPNRWLWVEHPKHADWIDKATITDFINAAEKHGVNPYYFLGMGMAESHLGNLHQNNPVRIDWDAHKKALAQQGITEDTSTPQGLIDFAAQLMQGHFKKYGKDPVTALQAYSGTGKTIYGGNPAKVKELYGTTTMFGKPFQQIDFWKEKPQGKIAYELSQLLKDNAAIRQMVENPKMRFKVNDYLASKEVLEQVEPDPTGLLKQLEFQ